MLFSPLAMKTVFKRWFANKEAMIQFELYIRQLKISHGIIGDNVYYNLWIVQYGANNFHTQALDLDYNGSQLRSTVRSTNI